MSRTNVDLVRRSFEAFGRGDFADPWSDRFGPATEWEDFIDCGDWVVAPWSARLHGHGSGIAIDVSETYAVLVRDGLITRVDEYRTVEQALGAVCRPGR